MKKSTGAVQPCVNSPISFKGYRFPRDVISYAVWLYYQFPLSLRMVEEMLAARGIELTAMLGHEVWSGDRPAHPFHGLEPQ